jgi:hypothetical protein
MADIIVGCYTNYDWNQIKFWANSIDKSGFQGDKAMIVYDSDFNTVQKLIDMKFNIFAFGRDDAAQRFTYPGNFSIVVQRFYHLWQYLSVISQDRQYDRVITTDVKDVIFQDNPSKWLDHNLVEEKILVSSESLRYRDEAWGNNNMARSFPMIHNWILDKTIYNCGVLAGETNTMKDLFLNIFLTSLGAPQQVPGGGGPDQAALNILLNLEPYKSITKFATSEEGWACQAGTTADPLKIDTFRPHLLEPEPAWDGEHVTTSTGAIFPIVHQWDRIPSWKSKIEQKYS